MHEEKFKPEGEIELETQIKNLRKQTKMIKQMKNAEICGNWKEKATREKVIQLEEIHQKVLAKKTTLWPL